MEVKKRKIPEPPTKLGEQKLSDNASTTTPPPSIMGITIKDLETAIRSAFPIIHLEIEDASSGCGENYSVFIVSSVSPPEIPMTQRREDGQLKRLTTF